MNNLDKQYLISIKSIFELRTGFSSLSYLLDKLSDKQLVNTISNEFKLMNYGKVILAIDNYLFEKFTNTPLFEKTDIKMFDFENISQETIDTIKQKIGLEKLELLIVKDNEGKETSLLRHWDNPNRFEVIIERELFDEIKENTELELNVVKEIILVNLGYYTKFTIEKHIEYQDNNDYDYNYNAYNSSNWLADSAGTDDPEVMNDVYWNLD
jgi:hypothetical protein